MTEKELRNRLNRLTGEIPAETHRAYLSAASSGKEKTVMNKKISVGLILALILAALTATGFAAGIVYNQEWWYSNRNSFVKHNQPDTYEAIMRHRVENPEQKQSEDALVNVAIQDVSWAPEAEKLTISFKASLKDPAHYELHSQWALDTDGAYVGEGGSTTAIDDGEERAVHWLWRDQLGGGSEERGYGLIPGWGPVADMMDDPGKQLLLIDCKGIHPQGGELAMSNTMDSFRTPEGDVVFVMECDLDWLNEAYAQRMQAYAGAYPDMKDYAEQQIAAAQAARALIRDGSLPCVLTYTVVRYTEGMADTDLYTGSADGQVEFLIRPGASQTEK